MNFRQILDLLLFLLLDLTPDSFPTSISSRVSSYETECLAHACVALVSVSVQTVLLVFVAENQSLVNVSMDGHGVCDERRQWVSRSEIAMHE